MVDPEVEVVQAGVSRTNIRLICEVVSGIGLKNLDLLSIHSSRDLI